MPIAGNIEYPSVGYNVLTFKTQHSFAKIMRLTATADPISRKNKSRNILWVDWRCFVSNLTISKGINVSTSSDGGWFYWDNWGTENTKRTEMDRCGWECTPWDEDKTLTSSKHLFLLNGVRMEGSEKSDVDQGNASVEIEIQNYSSRRCDRQCCPDNRYDGGDDVLHEGYS